MPLRRLFSAAMDVPSCIDFITALAPGFLLETRELREHQRRLGKLVFFMDERPVCRHVIKTDYEPRQNISATVGLQLTIIFAVD